METTKRQSFRCLQCGYRWIQFVTDESVKPEVCPMCNSHDWDISKKNPPRK